MRFEINIPVARVFQLVHMCLCVRYSHRCVPATVVFNVRCLRQNTTFRMISVSYAAVSVRVK